MANPQMTDGVLTVQFLAVMRGVVNLSGIVLNEISQSGVDGHAYIDFGIRGRPFEIVTTVDLDTTVVLALEKIIYAGFQGSLVTYTDHLLNIWNNLLVLDVEPIREMILFTPVGGISTNAGTMLVARWLLQNTSTWY